MTHRPIIVRTFLAASREPGPDELETPRAFNRPAPRSRIDWREWAPVGFVVFALLAAVAFGMTGP